METKKSVILITNQNGQRLFLTCNQCTHSPSKDIYINGIFGYKNAFQNDEQVTVTHFSDNLTNLKKVFVEPETMEDWETIELNAEYLERNLLHQIRCVSVGLLLPVWVGKVCLFMKIKSIDPEADFGILNKSTEVVISPKTAASQETVAKRPAPKLPPLKAEDTALISTKDSCSDSNTLWGRFLRMLDFLYYLFYRRTYSVWLQQKYLMQSWEQDFSLDKTVNRCIARVLDMEKLMPDVVDISDQVSQVTLLVDSASYEKFRTHTFLARLKPLRLPTRATAKLGGQKPAVDSANGSSIPSCYCVVRVEVKVIETLPLHGSFHVALNSTLRTRLEVKFSDKLELKQVQYSAYAPKSLRFEISSTEENLACMYRVALNCYIKRITSSGNAFVVFQHMLITVPLDKDSFVTTRLTFDVDQINRPEFCLLTKKLLSGVNVTFSKPQSVLPTIMGDPKDLEEPFFGLDSTLNKLVTFTQRHLVVSKSSAFLLIGGEGCGKTSLIRAAVDQLGWQPPAMQIYSHWIRCKTWKGKQPDTIRRLINTAVNQVLWRSPSLIVFDDLDVIAPRSPNVSINAPEEMMQEAIADAVRSAIVRLKTSEKGVVVLATVRHKDSLHERLAFASGCCVFKEWTEVEPLTQDMRARVISGLVSNQRDAFSSPDPGSRDEQEPPATIDVAELARRTQCFVAGDLERLVRQAGACSVLRSSKSGCQDDRPTPSVTMDDFEQCMKEFEALALREVSPPNCPFTLEDVGALDQAKQSLVEVFVWPVQFPELFAQSPIRLQHGALLYGPPGCGKSLLSLAIARETRMNFIMVKGPELLNKYIGASEKAVRNLFSRARNASPCLIFFDEFDSLAPRRGHDSTGVTDRVVNQLLTELDGVESSGDVFILAASNRPDLIDPALLRPGRIQIKIFCPLPDELARRSILACLSGDDSHHQCLPLSPLVTADQLDQLASRTAQFSSADLRGLLNRAGTRALCRLGLLSPGERDLGDGLEVGRSVVKEDVSILWQDLESVLDTIRPSLGRKEYDMYTAIYNKFSGNDTKAVLSEYQPQSTVAIHGKSTLS